MIDSHVLLDDGLFWATRNLRAFLLVGTNTVVGPSRPDFIKAAKSKIAQNRQTVLSLQIFVDVALKI